LTENSANFLLVQADIVVIEGEIDVLQADMTTVQNTITSILAAIDAIDSVLYQALSDHSVISMTTVLPGTGTQGDVYIVRSDDPTNPNQIAIWDDGAWRYVVPKAGNNFYVVDESTNYQWNGSSWEAQSGSSTSITTEINAKFDMDYVEDATSNRNLTDADLAGNRYIAMTSAGANTVTIPAGLTGTNPVTISQNGAGVTTFLASGTTLLSAEGKVAMAFQYSAVAVIPVGVDTYQLVGGLA